MKQNNIIAAAICASRFSWAKEGNCGRRFGVAEASTLGYKAGQTPGSQIYNDAMDFGFRVVSPKTGNVRTFVLYAESDGFWSYQDSADSNIFLTIFND